MKNVNVLNALMRCRNTDDNFRPEIASPHYFKMPNGQLVLFSTNGHILLVVKNTAGLMTECNFDEVSTPNIASAIPTDPCNSSLSLTDLSIALRKIGRACWDLRASAIEIEGVHLLAANAELLESVLLDLGIEGSVPMACSMLVPTKIKIETDDFLIVQAGMFTDDKTHIIKL